MRSLGFPCDSYNECSTWEAENQEFKKHRWKLQEKARVPVDSMLEKRKINKIFTKALMHPEPSLSMCTEPQPHQQRLSDEPSLPERQCPSAFCFKDNTWEIWVQNETFISTWQQQDPEFYPTRSVDLISLTKRWIEKQNVAHTLSGILLKSDTNIAWPSGTLEKTKQEDALCKSRLQSNSLGHQGDPVSRWAKVSKLGMKLIGSKAEWETQRKEKRGGEEILIHAMTSKTLNTSRKTRQYSKYYYPTYIK